MEHITSPVLWTILACEIGFWVLVIGGLALRYIVRARTASTIALALVPALDVILIAAVAIDLYRGGEVEFVHRLAGIYLGCTIMFGARLIAWADARFAHRFDGAPAPAKIPRYGPERSRKEWADFARWLGAAAIALVIAAGLGYTVATAQQREDLFQITGTLGVITVLWLVTGPLWVAGKRA